LWLSSQTVQSKQHAFANMATACELLIGCCLGIHSGWFGLKCLMTPAGSESVPDMLFDSVSIYPCILHKVLRLCLDVDKTQHRAAMTRLCDLWVSVGSSAAAARCLDGEKTPSTHVSSRRFAKTPTALRRHVKHSPCWLSLQTVHSKQHALTNMVTRIQGLLIACFSGN